MKLIAIFLGVFFLLAASASAAPREVTLGVAHCSSGGTWFDAKKDMSGRATLRGVRLKGGAFRVTSIRYLVRSPGKKRNNINIGTVSEPTLYYQSPDSIGSRPGILKTNFTVPTNKVAVQFFFDIAMAEEPVCQAEVTLR